MKRYIMSSLLGVALILNGCATIVQSGPDEFRLTTIPDGADVSLNGVPIGKTPLLVSVRRKDDCLLEIKKAGYQTVTIDKRKVVAGWFFGNIAFAAVIGMGIDLIAHNQGKYSESPMAVNLVKAN